MTNELSDGKPNAITVKTLKDEIKNLPDDAMLIFQGELTFYRVKHRGLNLYQIEFNETIIGSRIGRTQ